MPAHTGQQRVDGTRGHFVPTGFYAPTAACSPERRAGADGPGICLQDGGRLGQRRRPKDDEGEGGALLDREAPEPAQRYRGAFRRHRRGSTCTGRRSGPAPRHGEQAEAHVLDVVLQAAATAGQGGVVLDPRRDVRRGSGQWVRSARPQPRAVRSG